MPFETVVELQRRVLTPMLQKFITLIRNNLMKKIHEFFKPGIKTNTIQLVMSCLVDMIWDESILEKNQDD